MDPARAQQARRPAGERGDGPRGRQGPKAAGRRARRRHARLDAAHRDADPAGARAARRHRALGASAASPAATTCRSTRSGSAQAAALARRSYGDGGRGRQLTAAARGADRRRRSPARSGSRSQPIDDLAELDFGAWEGLSMAEARAQDAAAVDAWLGVAGRTRRPAASRSPRSPGASGAPARRCSPRIPDARRRRGQPRDADQDARPARARRAAGGDVPPAPGHRVGVDRSTTSPTATPPSGWSTTPPPARLSQLTTPSAATASHSAPPWPRPSTTGTVSSPNAWNVRARRALVAGQQAPPQQGGQRPGVGRVRADVDAQQHRQHARPGAPPTTGTSARVAGRLLTTLASTAATHAMSSSAPSDVPSGTQRAAAPCRARAA